MIRQLHSTSRFVDGQEVPGEEYSIESCDACGKDFPPLSPPASAPVSGPNGERWCRGCVPTNFRVCEFCKLAAFPSDAYTNLCPDCAHGAEHGPGR